VPLLGSHAGRAHAGTAPGGAVTFEIDAAAEELLSSFISAKAPSVAFFSEDQGLVTPADGPAEAVLIVDPIDGTRPAMAGLEAACVSVALAPLGEGSPRMGDVQIGCVQEIKSGDRFLAERGGGVQSTVELTRSENEDLTRLFWAYGFRGRPARELVEVIGDLIDSSSVGGGTFDLGSACFDMTRVLTGQLDAYIEPSPLMIERVPGVRAAFTRVGDGEILNNSPYDLAAATLCLQEGGVLVTDAAGRALDDRPLLGSDGEFQMSVLASANKSLHVQLLTVVEQGIERLAHATAGPAGGSDGA
jgi:myo-inositol-1(or 4)-monophosphatase